MKKVFAIFGVVFISVICTWGFVYGFELAQAEETQAEEAINVQGIAGNDYVGDVACTFTIENGGISGECANDYFGKIIFGDEVSLSETDDIYSVSGYGVFENPFTISDSDTINNVYLGEENDPVKILDTDIVGTMKNEVIGDMVFGEATPSVCGDGVKRYDEACDDGNTDDGDGCSESCEVEEGWTCSGSPSVCTEGEEIKQYPFQVASVYPFNGALDVALSQPVIFILTGTVDREDFEESANFGTIEGVSYEWVSDQVVRVDHDDFTSNTLYTFTVLDAYTFSFRTVIPAATSLPVITCGDGYYDDSEGSLEECDDGNRKSGDGCSASCEVEEGWTCSGTMSDCVQDAPVCGDGFMDGEYNTEFGYSVGYAPSDENVEQCDDGNTSSGDGCDENCQAEANFACVGSPSVCLVYSSQESVIVSPPVTLPTLFTWFDADAGTREPAEEYSFRLDGYEIVSADWIDYNEQTGEFYVTDLPGDLPVGEYLFSIRHIETNQVANATIRIADVERFVDTQGDFQLLHWLSAIIAAPEGSDVAELGTEDKTAQAANLIALAYLYQQFTSN